MTMLRDLVKHKLYSMYNGETLMNDFITVEKVSGCFGAYYVIYDRGVVVSSEATLKEATEYLLGKT